MPSEVLERSRSIQQHLLSLPLWQQAGRVALYVSIGNEVQTHLLLDAAWKAGKTVLLPRCLPPDRGEGLMEFAVCPDRALLVPAPFGLLEPGSACPVADRLPDVLVIPAVGLNNRGARIGYGKGYYDRLLMREGWASIPRIALIYALQVGTFSEDPTDQPMHACITENGLSLFNSHIL